MITFIDNTAVHSIHSALNKECSRSVDAYSLLHVAENILFAERMIVSSFERPQTKELTQETLIKLKKLGCIDNEKDDLIQIVDFSNDHFVQACEKSIPMIIEDLKYLDFSSFQKYSIKNSFLKPIGFVNPVIQKWISCEWEIQKREEVKQLAINDISTSANAFDYIIASNDQLYELLNEKTKNIKKDINALHLIDVICKLAINQELAKLQCGVYSPAPQRANLISEFEQTFRYALLNGIQCFIESRYGKLASKTLNRIKQIEKLPLPLFAIHFLDKEEFNSPESFLLAARKMRDAGEVKAIREWLKKWESVFNSEDYKKKIKAKQQLLKVLDDIELNSNNLSISSILRFEGTIGPDSISVGIDLSGLEPTVKRLFNLLNRRKIFLSMLTKKFAADDRIGARFINKLKKS